MQERVFEINGTKVCAFTNTHLNSFCLAVYVRAGCMYETPDTNGITHLLEHVIFRNLKKKFEGFYEKLALYGLDFSGCTYKEFMHLSVSGDASGFGFAIEVLCGIFDEIQISSEEFNFEKRRIKAEIREKDERNSLEYFYNKAVWEGTGLEKTILGYCRVLDRLSLKRLNEFKKHVFSKGNFFIYVTGNVGDQGIDLLKSKVSALNADKSVFSFNNEVNGAESFFDREGAVRIKESHWHYVLMGFDVDSRKFSGGVLDMLYAILFKGEKSLIHNRLSEDDPLIYSFDSTYEQYNNLGNINLQYEIQSDNLEKSIERVFKTLRALKRGEFNFEANLRAELSAWNITLDDPVGLNWDMAYYNHILKTEPIDYSKHNFGRLSGVTGQQIIHAASEIFQRKNLTLTVKGSKRRIRSEQIDKLLDLLS